MSGPLFCILEGRPDGTVKLATESGRTIVDTADELARLPFFGPADLVAVPADVGDTITVTEFYEAFCTALDLSADHPFRKHLSCPRR